MSETFDSEKIVYFGDSLTDDGNLFSLTQPLLFFPIPFTGAGYDQKFSDGDVYAEYTPDLLGVSDVENYGIGNAQALGNQTVGDVIFDSGAFIFLKVLPFDPRLDFQINLEAQVNRFLADTAGEDRSTTSASLLIGLNDYGGFEPSNNGTALVEALALQEAVVAETLAAADALARAGVGQVVINTLPVPAFFPRNANEGPAALALGETLLDAHNTALREGAADLEATYDVDVVVVELEALTAEIVADQATFGFIAPLAEPAVLLPLPVPINNPEVAGFDDDQVAFFDDVHPTTALHGVIGVFTAESLTSNVVLLDDAPDDITLGSADDLVLASGGQDNIFLGAGDDVAFGGRSNDELSGRDDDDILAGGNGQDDIRGGKGADVLAGNLGDDTLDGGLGADVLIGGLGSDFMHGRGGDDMFLYTEASLIGGTTGTDMDEIRGGAGTDTLYLALTDETRARVEADIANGADPFFAALNLRVTGVEEIVFVDARTDLAALDSDARLGEADLWGLV